MAGTYQTDGLGGALAGSVVDHLASQGSLAYSTDHALLLAVNAGSNTVSVFRVNGDRLALQQILPSGGTFPVSEAVHGDLVYVLNALNGGSVQGYRIVFGLVLPMFGSNRALGLNPTATPQFTNTPGQVAFTPDGSQPVVTTKADGSRRFAHRDRLGRRCRGRWGRRDRGLLTLGVGRREPAATSGVGPGRQSDSARELSTVSSSQSPTGRMAACLLQ